MNFGKYKHGKVVKFRYEIYSLIPATYRPLVRVCLECVNAVNTPWTPVVIFWIVAARSESGIRIKRTTCPSTKGSLQEGRPTDMVWSIDSKRIAVAGEGTQK